MFLFRILRNKNLAFVALKDCNMSVFCSQRIAEILVWITAILVIVDVPLTRHARQLLHRGRFSYR